MRKINLIYFFVLFLTLISCNEAPVDQNGNPIVTSNAPELFRLQASRPLTLTDEVYIDVIGRNLGGPDWQASLSLESEVIPLESRNLTDRTVRLVVPATAKLMKGVYKLFVSNAFGQDTGTLTTLQGPRGLEGPPGPTGPIGLSGPQGPRGFQGRDAPPCSVSKSALSSQLTIDCPDGSQESFTPPTTYDRIRPFSIPKSLINPYFGSNTELAVLGYIRSQNIRDEKWMDPQVDSHLVYRVPDDWSRNWSKSCRDGDRESDGLFLPKECESRKISVCFASGGLSDAQDVTHAFVQILKPRNTRSFELVVAGEGHPKPVAGQGNASCISTGNTTFPEVFYVKRLGSDSRDTSAKGIFIEAIFLNWEAENE